MFLPPIFSVGNEAAGKRGGTGSSLPLARLKSGGDACIIKKAFSEAEYELIALSAITCPAKLCETCQKNFPPFFDVKIEEIML
ncbi:hypothetical protein CEJ87_16095 [Caldifermentibacillus hisashii]|nr:hypothetical protein CEJ87_16095 [Caldifermentibacillus hisashii]